MVRNKEGTKKKLLDAVGNVILKEGFSGLGINVIAKEANVDKVLIYRYFDNLDGLLKAYVIQKDYYSNVHKVKEKLKNSDSVGEAKEISKSIFSEQLEDVLKNKELQEILLWELSSDNEITKALANEREKEGMEILKLIENVGSKKKMDVPAVAAILLGGIYYLVIRSRKVSIFNGIKLNTKNGWKRISKSIDNIIDNLM